MLTVSSHCARSGSFIKATNGRTEKKRERGEKQQLLSEGNRIMRHTCSMSVRPELYAVMQHEEAEGKGRVGWGGEGGVNRE